MRKYPEGGCGLASEGGAIQPDNSIGLPPAIAVMAIAQLKVDTEMLRLVTAIVLAAGARAFGISFGFGARDIVREIRPVAA